MKDLFKDIKLNFITMIMFGLLFPLIICCIGQLFPVQANGFPIYKNGILAGFENVGQNFYSDKYFWGRPSAVNYDASASAGSNKGPTNKEYLNEVENRIKNFLKRNSGVKRADIPSELVTASGSGLDPHISLQAAYIQVKRVAKARNLNKTIINSLLKKYTEYPLFGVLGPQKINVLKLNLALDKMSK